MELEIQSPDVPYPDMIAQVGERVAKRSKDEFIEAQTILYRKEEQEKKDGSQKKGDSRRDACVLAGTPR